MSVLGYIVSLKPGLPENLSPNRQTKTRDSKCMKMDDLTHDCGKSKLSSFWLG